MPDFVKDELASGMAMIENFQMARWGFISDSLIPSFPLYLISCTNFLVLMTYFKALVV